MPRLLFLVWLLAAFTVVADARPGGGETSSGGSRTESSSSSSSSGGSYRSSGGGYQSPSKPSSPTKSTTSSTSSSSGYSSGSGSGGSNVMLIAFGIVGVLVLIIVGANILWYYQAKKNKPANLPKKRKVELEPLLRGDPDFSRAVFEDFVFDLYSAVHRDRANANARYAPYLSATAVEQLASRGPAPQQVVIGALSIERVQLPEIIVRIEATLIGDTPMFAIERWFFTRAPSAKSRPPSRTRTWPCPSCGAPWQGDGGRTCAHCGAIVDGGRFDWELKSIIVVSEKKALASLRGTVPEQGNDLPTVEDLSAPNKLKAIEARDPHVTWDALTARIRLIYKQLNTAWNDRDLGKVRGFITASLRNYLDYWLREYARQGLYNKLADANVKKIELAKVTRDRYFDAVTVRIFADGVDYTRTEENGKIVGGSKDKRRPYTEYWTFVRSAERKGVVHTDVACPNCGATPIAMSDIGDCTHCNAAIENGSIDWTLSRIEQDDSYAG